MPRPFLKKLKDWKWYGEQQAHHLLGFAIVAAVFALGCWWVLR